MTKPKAGPKGSAGHKLPTSAEVLLRTPADPDAERAVDLAFAAATERRKQRTFDAAVQFAIGDDHFRRGLAKKLRDLGEGIPRRGTTGLELQTVATAVQLLRLQLEGTRRGHLLRMPRLFDEIARLAGITPGQARSRYYKAEARGLLDMPSA